MNDFCFFKASLLPDLVNSHIASLVLPLLTNFKICSREYNRLSLYCVDVVSILISIPFAI